VRGIHQQAPRVREELGWAGLGWAAPGLAGWWERGVRWGWVWDAPAALP